MSQFREKPVVIEAVQFDGSLESLEGMSIPDVSQEFGSNTCQIQTLEGAMTASPGDWIICGVKGEHYPCNPDVFAATYEAVASRAASPLMVALLREECDDADRYGDGRLDTTRVLEILDGAPLDTSTTAAAPTDARNLALEEAATILEGGSFMHAESPAAKLAKDAARAIRGLKSAASAQAVPPVVPDSETLDILRALTLATDEGDDAAQGTHYVGNDGRIRCKGSFLALIERARAALKGNAS